MVEKDNMALKSEATAGAAPVDVRSVQVAGDGGSKR